MPGPQFTVDDGGVIRELQKLPQRANEAVYDAFRDIGNRFVRVFIKAKLSRRWRGGGDFRSSALKGSSSRKYLYRRTGSLARGMRSRATRGRRLRDTMVEFGWMTKHGAMIASVHEEGATIRAKKKWLTIPLPAAMTPSGVPRWPNAAAAGKARGVNGRLIRIRGPSGAFILAGVKRMKRRSDIVPLYVLKPQVRIPPRLEFRKTFDRWFDKRGSRRMEQALEDFLR